MRTALTALCCAGAIGASSLAGCAGPDAPPPSITSAAPPAPAGPAGPVALPPPQALAEVVSRLADPAIPGKDKLALVAGATAPDAAALDGFATALRDGGYTPVTVGATDVGWSDTQPGDVRALITIAGPPDRDDPPGSEFRFPLEFTAHAGGWQLNKETADLLLALGP